jgi:hypothetical protein
MATCKLCGTPASRIAPRTSISSQGPGNTGLWAYLCERHVEQLPLALQAKAYDPSVGLVERLEQAGVRVVVAGDDSKAAAA